MRGIKLLKDAMKKGQLFSLYIFTGEETFVLDSYLRRISDVLKCKPTFVDKIEDAYSLYNEKTLIKTNRCIVVANDTDSIKNADLVSQLEHLQVVEGRCIILVYSTLDKRSRFYRDLEDNITIFEKMTPAVIASMLQRDFNLSQQNALEFAERCLNDYGKIMHEIKKVQFLAQKTGKTMNECFAIATTEDLIHRECKDSIFDLVAAVLTKDAVQAFTLAEDVKKTEPTPLVFVSVMYNTVRNTLCYKDSKIYKEISTVTGLTPFECKLAATYESFFDLYELAFLLTFLRDVEVNFKRGLISPEYVYDYIITTICV